MIGSIVLTGQTPAQVVALTRRADVLVHPRLACRENFSVQSKIAVYLASGRPIVATDFGDYSHILGATGAGRLTAVSASSLAEGVLDVLGDPALASRLSAAAGPVAAELFGMERNIDRYLDVYNRARSRPLHAPRSQRRDGRMSPGRAVALMRSDKNEKLGEKTFVVKGVSV